MTIKFVLLLILIICTTLVSADESLIGTRPPTLKASEWFNAKPINIENLKGKVVLIRWWTGPDCPFCKASSVALNTWHEKYANQGLQVIGMYHHKDDSPLTPENVKTYADNFGFYFPIGIDTNWNTLNQWWLFKKRDWTSVSFLLDKNGVIQHIHPGGEYIEGNADYIELEQKIINLLNE